MNITENIIRKAKISNAPIASTNCQYIGSIPHRMYALSAKNIPFLYSEFTYIPPYSPNFYFTAYAHLVKLI